MRATGLSGRAGHSQHAKERTCKKDRRSSRKGVNSASERGGCLEPDKSAFTILGTNPALASRADQACLRARSTSSLCGLAPSCTAELTLISDLQDLVLKRCVFLATRFAIGQGDRAEVCIAASGVGTLAHEKRLQISFLPIFSNQALDRGRRRFRAAGTTGGALTTFGLLARLVGFLWTSGQACGFPLYARIWNGPYPLYEEARSLAVWAGGLGAGLK